MLKYLRRQRSRRKMRLFVSESLLPFFLGWYDTTEHLAALPCELDLWVEGREAEILPGMVVNNFLYFIAESSGYFFDFARLIWDSDWLDACRMVDRTVDLGNRWRYADILRDILGNPFRPVAFLPLWRTDTVVALARTMYDSRDFSAMPILADALQDAGCENEHVLNHCRDANATHVRGCWVLDGILQKS